jgi:RNA polymerase sigma-70 factor (ECF subfamily)
MRNSHFALSEALFPERLCEVPAVTYSRAVGQGTDDTALMLRYKDGDVAAFEALYRRNNDALYRYLLRLCMNRDAAEDIYQDVWRKIIDSRKRYRATAKFTTFLYRVAHNSFIDYIRRNKRYTSGDAFDVNELVSNADQPEQATEKLLLRDRLDVALRNLPAEQRDAFLLHEEAGLGLEAIAVVTGANRETVKSRLRYANNKLKDALMKPVEKTKGIA